MDEASTTVPGTWLLYSFFTGNVNLPFLMETKLSEKYFRLLRSMVSSFVLICPSACSFF